jgi:hypothetical protein
MSAVAMESPTERARDVLTKLGKRYRRGKKRLTRRWMLASTLPKHAVCAEIGVYEGKFSQRIMKYSQPSKLHLIDPWHFEPSPEYEKSFYGAAANATGQQDMDRRLEGVKAMFSSQLADGSVVIHRKTSSTAAADFPDSYFDWIYIDGNHLYEFVLEDLKLFLPKMKPGGYLCGDDYHDRPVWFEAGVKRAVDEFVKQGLAKPVFFRGDQFVLRV